MTAATSAAVSTAQTAAIVGPGYLLAMLGVVAFGAVIPIVPTGAAVSVGAALTGVHHPVRLTGVVLVGAAGAYLGDLITYAVLRAAGEPLARRVGWLQAGPAQESLARVRARIERHELRVLLLSRLVPGGRIPVLLAAALGGYPFRRFASADIAAALLWSLVYAGIGVAGASVFAEPWEAVLAAIVVVLGITLLSQLWQRRRSRLLRRGGGVLERRADRAPL